MLSGDIDNEQERVLNIILRFFHEATRTKKGATVNLGQPFPVALSQDNHVIASQFVNQSPVKAELMDEFSGRPISVYPCKAI